MEKWNTQTLRTSPLEEMSTFFDNRAEIYNEVHLENISGGIESKQVIASFLPSNTKAIIDLGVGTGLELEEIFRIFPDVEITGFDISENMLKQLKARYPNENIQLQCASYLSADFVSNYYDVALSVMTLHHYNHKVKTELYRKIYSCIKQNGIYIECDYMLSETDYENAQAMEEFYFSEYERLKETQGLTDNREYHYDTPCAVSSQIEMLSNAGFTRIKEVWHKGNTVILMAQKD